MLNWNEWLLVRVLFCIIFLKRRRSAVRRMSNLRDNLLNLEGSISTVLDNFFTSPLCIYNSGQSSIICMPDGIACATFAIGSRIINIRSPFSFLLPSLFKLYNYLWKPPQQNMKRALEAIFSGQGNWLESCTQWWKLKPGAPKFLYVARCKKRDNLPNETPCLHAPHLARGPRGRYPFFGWTVRAILAWHRGYSAYDLRQYFKT